MKNPCITELDKRLTVETPVRTDEDGGAAIISWQPAGDVWGKLTPSSGRETVAADAIGLRVTHTLQIRFRDDLTGAMRFTLGMRVFEIRALHDPDEHRRWLVCQLEERRA